MSEKTHWKKAFNKDYLGAHDLEEGQELKVIIDCVQVKEILDPNGKKEKRNVAFFKQKIKPMILNATACKQIARFAGSHFIENWTNIPIQIYAKEVKAFGEVVEALRIRDQQPRLDKPALTPESDKWSTAIDRAKKSGIEAVLKFYSLSDEHLEILKNAAIPQHNAE